MLVAASRSALVSNFKLISGTKYKIGGDLERETEDNFGSDVNQGSSNLLIKIWGKLFRIHKGKVYQYDSSAYKMFISAMTNNFTKGRTLTDGTSGATCEVVETNKAGEDFVLVKTISGTFGAGNTVTESISGETATVDVAPVQGGDTGFKGENKLVFEPSVNLLGTGSFTGAYPFFKDGESSFFFLFAQSTGAVRSVQYRPVTDDFVESGDLLTPGSTQRMNTQTVGSFIDNTLIVPAYTGSNSGTRTFYVYNPQTDNVSLVSFAASPSNANSLSSDVQFVKFKDLVVGAMMNSSSSNIYAQIGKITGGISSILKENNATNTHARYDRGSLLVPFGNFLYQFFKSMTGYWCLKYFESGGVLYPAHGGEDFIAGSRNKHYHDEILPGGLTAGVSLGAVLRLFVDQEENTPTGLDVHNIFFINDKAGGNVDRYKFRPYIDSTLTYTWDGTTTVVASGDAAAIDGLAAGKFITIGNTMFRVTAVGGVGNVDVTIENPETLTIPTASDQTIQIEQTMVLHETITGLADMSLSASVTGGGERSFVKGQPDIAPVGASAGVGGRVYAYRPFIAGEEPDTPPAITVRGYYGPDGGTHEDTKMKLKDPSEGTLAETDTEVQGVTADGEIKTLTWDIATQFGSLVGVNAQSRRVVLEGEA
jgi:hypothetical protein